MVTIYSVYYNRPEFLSIQYNQLLKYCTDSFEFIVLNNGMDQNTTENISKECLRLNIKEINFIQLDRHHYCSHDHIQALDYLYHNYVNVNNTSKIRVVMDSDIFAFSKFSFYDLLKDYDVVGLSMINYFSAIYTMYNNTVDLTGFEINAKCADSGSGTGVLMLKYNTKGIIHTAPIRKKEADYIFKNSNKDTIKYDETWGFQFIGNCFLHYYRGTGWDNGNIDYYKAKFNFLNHFLQNTDNYNINLDNNISYENALTDQWLNPQNYKLLKVINND